MIKQALWSACFLAAVAAAPGTGAAQSPGDGPLLRLRWQADPARDGVAAVCGEVLNDGTLAAEHVRLLVEELDGNGRVINSRELEVLGEVPADGRSYFCVPEPVGSVRAAHPVAGLAAVVGRQLERPAPRQERRGQRGPHHDRGFHRGRGSTRARNEAPRSLSTSRGVPPSS